MNNAEIGAYLAAIIESSDDAIISKNLDGTITSWNRAAERIFGYTSDEIVGRHISVLIPKDRLREENEIIEKLRRGERVNHFESVRVTKTGELVDISLTVSPIRNADGVIIGASKVARDITAWKRTVAELRELNIRKDEFLANMSHELRTPMNAVVGLATILGNTSPLTEKQKKFIETLKTSADNLLALINDLLDFSKLESDNVQFENIEFDLKEIFFNLSDMMGLRAREKGLKLTVDYQPALDHYFVGDPLRINQVLTNLVGNAIKFTEEGSVHIKVAGDNTGDPDTTMIAIDIVDTGIGIPADKKRIIFDKFSQADASFTRKYGGSGLGLSICKTIVDKMGGTLEVESVEGQGSTFFLRLPLKDSLRPSSVLSMSLPAPQSCNGRKSILLVEDYLPNIVVATEFLEYLGYEYDTATSGLEALKKFQQTTYDVILMDVQMYGIDGLETARRIRKLEQSKNMTPTPIIAMTAHVREESRDACIEAGMNDFVPKPFDLQELQQKINTQISEKKKAAGA